MVRFDFAKALEDQQRREQGLPPLPDPIETSPIEDSLWLALERNVEDARRSNDHEFAGAIVFMPLPTTANVVEFDGSTLRGRHGLVERLEFDIHICRQVRIRGFCVDFLLWEPGVALAVECDGHKFHERTTEQVAHDRARDRELLRFGVPTIRFTGTEIHRDARRCAREVADTWNAIAARRRAG